MKTYVIELTEQEAQNMVELFDIATKAAGLRAAEVALPIIAKIGAARMAADKQPNLDMPPKVVD